MRKFFLLFLSIFLIAQEVPKITADYQRKIGDVLEARGDVEISSSQGKVYADVLRVNLKTGEAELRGNVTLITKNSFIAGNEAKYNIKTGKMIFKDAWGWAKPGIFIQGKEIKGESKKEFTFEGGWFTPCNQTCPVWDLRARRGKYIVDDHISMWGTVLRIKGIPVFYFPYIYYPAKKKKRKTGFLMPKFGYSSSKGYYLGEDFFWAPRDWFDLTLSYDYFSNLGGMTSGEYRYIANPGNYGKALISYLKYKEGNYDYLIKGAEVHDMGKKWKLNGNFNTVSSYEFLWNLSTNYQTAVQRNFYSSLYLTKSWMGGSFILKADEQRSFYGGEPVIFRHLPEMNLTMTRKRILGSLYFSHTLLGDYIQKEKKKEMQTLQRIVYTPSLYLTLAPLPWVSFDNSLNFHMAYYSDSKEGNKRKGEPLKIFTYSYTGILTGPIFYRIFNTPSLSYSPKFKHIIEPVITFTYSPRVSSYENVISYDRYDYFPQANFFSFALNNRIMAKKKVGDERTPVEIFSFSVGGNYYPNPENVLSALGTKITHKFSSLNLNLRFSPTERISLYWLGTLDPYGKDFLYNSITLSFKPKSFPLYANLNYFTTQSPKEEQFNFLTSQMRLSGGLKISPLGLNISGVWDYDIKRKNTRQYTLYATLNLQCIMFLFRFSYLPFRKEKYFFNVSFSLPQVGIGVNRFGG